MSNTLKFGILEVIQFLSDEALYVSLSEWNYIFASKLWSIVSAWQMIIWPKYRNCLMKINLIWLRLEYLNRQKPKGVKCYMWFSQSPYCM